MSDSIVVQRFVERLSTSPLTIDARVVLQNGTELFPSEYKALLEMHEKYKKRLKDLFSMGVAFTEKLNLKQEKLIRDIQSTDCKPFAHKVDSLEFIDPLTKKPTIVALFKACKDVRGVQKEGSAFAPPPGKDGILPNFELINEVIVAALHSLPQAVAPAEVDDASGIVVSYIPEAIHLNSMKEEEIAKIPVEEIQRLAILDISLCNTDRNRGNLLVSRGKLYFIDNGLILPRGFESSANFCWTAFPQSAEKFTESAMKQIADLDFEKDCKFIQARMHPNYPVHSLETMHICYNLLKWGAEDGLTPRQIACFLTRDTSSGVFNYSPMRKAYELARSYRHNPVKIFQILEKWIQKEVIRIAKEKTPK